MNYRKKLLNRSFRRISPKVILLQLKLDPRSVKMLPHSGLSLTPTIHHYGSENGSNPQMSPSESQILWQPPHEAVGLYPGYHHPPGFLPYPSQTLNTSEHQNEASNWPQQGLNVNYFINSNVIHNYPQPHYPMGFTSTSMGFPQPAVSLAPSMPPVQNTASVYSTPPSNSISIKSPPTPPASTSPQPPASAGAVSPLSEASLNNLVKIETGIPTVTTRKSSKCDCPECKKPRRKGKKINSTLYFFLISKRFIITRG